MSMIIGCSIDVMKIDKTKLVDGKNGAKYYNFTVSVNDKEDLWGKDCSVSEGQTKEQRAAKEAKKFIGNGKVLYNSAKSGSRPAGQSKSTDPADDKLPW